MLSMTELIRYRFAEYLLFSFLFELFFMSRYLLLPLLLRNNRKSSVPIQ